MSLGYSWDKVPTRKLQDLNIPKKFNLFGKFGSIKSANKQHSRGGGQTEIDA